MVNKMLRNNRFCNKILVNTTKRFKIVQSPLSLVVFGQGFNVGEHGMVAKNFQDLTGMRFGRLIVLSLDSINKYRQSLWLCKCDCGNTKIIRGNHLKTKRIKSCGCLKKEKFSKKHQRLFDIWVAMKKRCLKKYSIDYKYYGARGIKICNEWQQFEPFYNWAINNGYTDDLTIDRINVNGNYEPNNCRWATKKEQARNRSNNRLITYNNETHCFSEWADIVGLKRITLERRINNFGWSVEKALTTPSRGGKRSV